VGSEGIEHSLYRDATPLHIAVLAVTNSDLEGPKGAVSQSIKLLIDAGANLQAKNALGLTPLLLAVSPYDVSAAAQLRIISALLDADTTPVSDILRAISFTQSALDIFANAARNPGAFVGASLGTLQFGNTVEEVRALLALHVDRRKSFIDLLSKHLPKNVTVREASDMDDLAAELMSGEYMRSVAGAL
jgi:hypothetical protein